MNTSEIKRFKDKMFKETSQRARVEQAIINAFDLATKSGYKIAVASDEEANSFNFINPHDFLYGDTQDKVIALGVWKMADEGEVLKD